MAHGHRHRPSLLGALLWVALGLLFLVHNFGYGPDFWWLLGHYWPVLLILLGLGKILEYFLKREAVSIRVGEIIGILVLLLIGSMISRTFTGDLGQIIGEMPIEIGGTSMRPGQWIGESHTYSEEVAYTLGSTMPIRIENSYGSVSVTPGSDREIRVRLKKVIYGDEAGARSFAAEIHLQGETEGQTGPPATLKAEAEPGMKADARRFAVRTNRESFSSRHYSFNTDMEVLVPKNSQVQVINSFGKVQATGIDGKLELSTTHGSLELRDCTGQFDVSDHYGECLLANLKGDLHVDGRGRVYVENVKGDVTVKDEYSPVEIQNVDGKLSVTSTESSLSVQHVTKPVVIDARGTQVQVRDLRDSLKIATSHRDVEISEVASQVSIESRYATLNLKAIAGDIDINSSSDSVSADDIRGRFVLKARGTGVRANGIRGPLSIQTTLKDVVINDFGDSCTIANEYAGISLAAESLGKGDVNVKNRNGNVELFLPGGASFLINATARNGKVESDYAGLTPTRSANTGTLKSRIKAGGPTITVETDSSDIHIYSTRGEGHKKTNDDKEDEQVLFLSKTPSIEQRSAIVLPTSLGSVR